MCVDVNSPLDQNLVTTYLFLDILSNILAAIVSMNVAWMSFARRPNLFKAAVPFLCCTSPLHRKLRLVREHDYPPFPEYLKNADHTDIDSRLLHFLTLDMSLARL